MRDLRRRALESNKTVSRKAQSRGVSVPNSRTPSAHSSRQSSRNVSRHPSDDEEEDDDDTRSVGTAWSNISAEESTAGEDAESSRAPLQDVIKELIDRKRSSVQGREDYLHAFVRMLTAHYQEEELGEQMDELLKVFAKSIRSEISDKETILALRATALMAVTMLDDTIYPSMSSVVKRAVMDSASFAVKAAAIRTLSACTIFGGAGDDGILEQMNFLMEIAMSDGAYVEAADDSDTVTAALEEWGFLASHIEDLEVESEEAVEAFADQLESSETSVQVAAGENIALLYEKSYTPREEDESDEEDNYNVTDDDRSSTPSDDEDDNGAKLIKRYDAYHNTHRIIRQVEALAHISGRHINKKDKRSLHTNFTSILNTVINPRRGPQYSNAIDFETNHSYGSRKTVKFHRNSYMRVDRWWKWIRLAGMRRILGGGFIDHYFEGNRAILETLPVTLDVGNSGPAFSGGKTKSGKRGAGRVKGADVLSTSH
ncbi:IFRD domain-containing protein [Nannizzia gypsea CBS 118893]|uniref:IFRD domain-containing protein n=1 Tax=Arthroderma gypseum (strain ATCC MYA-4604 / CBS 118893) TaxID=535722 RepID=E4UWZ6_ARTGP|nr:IFRD domain-containing protein [Nannizzia gypsea CBS 118893]EFR02635.1 IFRD domain-containing protein [Nannizzia gypsea CBS 118893]